MPDRRERLFAIIILRRNGQEEPYQLAIGWKQACFLTACFNSRYQAGSNYPDSDEECDAEGVAFIRPLGVVEYSNATSGGRSIAGVTAKLTPAGESTERFAGGLRKGAKAKRKDTEGHQVATDGACGWGETERLNIATRKPSPDRRDKFDGRLTT